MPYYGNNPATIFESIPAVSTSLMVMVAIPRLPLTDSSSVQDVLVSVDGVVQEAGTLTRT